MVSKIYRLFISVFIIISVLSIVVLAQKSVDAEESLQVNYEVHSRGNIWQVYLKKNGTVWTSGSNECGQLGDDKVRYRETPEQIPDFDGVIHVLLGDYYAVALRADGTVWGWGGSSKNGTNVVYSAKPLKFKDIDNVEKIYLQESGCIAIRKDGSVWSFKPFSDELPAQVKGLENVKSLKIDSQILALSEDGSVWSFKPFSDEAAKQIKELKDIIALESGPFSDVLALSKEGDVWSFKPDTDELPQQIVELRDITALKSSPLDTRKGRGAGTSYVLAIGKDGSVWTWGNGEYGQLGDGTYGDLKVGTKDNIKTSPVKISGLKNIKSAYVGWEHVVALSEDGCVYTWGSNFCGQLGDNTSVYTDYTGLSLHGKPITEDSIKAVPTMVFTRVKSVVANHGCVNVLSADGKVYSWGNYGIYIDGVYKQKFNPDTMSFEYVYETSDPLAKIDTTKPYQLTELSDIIDIINSYAVKSDGTLWTFAGSRVKQIQGINLLKPESTPMPTSTPVPTPTSTNTPEPIFEIVLQINNPHMVFNGIEKDIDSGKDTSPVIVDGRTLLPIRALIEELGGTVEWDEKTKGVLIDLDKKKINLVINSKKAVVNGEDRNLDVPPMIIKNRTMVPLRFIIENLGYDVQWEEDTQKIIISNAKNR